MPPVKELLLLGPLPLVRGHFNFLLIAVALLLLYLSTRIEDEHAGGSKLVSIPAIFILVAGFNWHLVQNLMR